MRGEGTPLSGERDDRESRGSSFGSGDTLLSRAGAENARPSLTGQERSGPAGRSVVTIVIFFFLFTNCTATSVLFINFFFISAVTSVYFTAGTCNVCTYAYACASV